MGLPLRIAVPALVTVLSMSLPLQAATLTVGPGKMYAKPCAAIAAASDGDTIEIDAAGAYDGDVCGIAKNSLTLRGVGGRPKIDAAGKNYGGKGIWVISGNDTTVENIEFSGATVPDQNGAGIRQEGNNLVVRRCYFHDNEDGILSGGSAMTGIIVEYSEFANNGSGDGFSHNMYIGHEGRFILRYSYSHHAKVGHLVKSRATENYILYNRLSGEDGTASYELDLPNAGTSYVIGNLIEQGPATQNSAVMTYGVEGITAENPGHDLFVVNNTFVNDRPAGATFIMVGSAITTPAVIINNIFSGGGTITNQTGATQTTNFAQGDPKLVDPAAYDYRLAPGSPCINAGSDPGAGQGFALLPSRQYVHPASAIDRMMDGTLDIGAYEFGAGAGSDAGPDATGRADGSGGGGGSGSADARPPDSATSDAATLDIATSDAPSPPLDVATTDATSPPPASVPPIDSGGCGCRTSRRPLTPNAAFVLLVSAFVAHRRCRRVRRQAPGRGQRPTAGVLPPTPLS